MNLVGCCIGSLSRHRTTPEFLPAIRPYFLEEQIVEDIQKGVNLLAGHTPEKHAKFELEVPSNGWNCVTLRTDSISYVVKGLS